MNRRRLLLGLTLGVVLSGCYGGSGYGQTLATQSATQQTAPVSAGTASILATTIQTHNCPTQGRLAAVGLSKGTAFWVAFPSALDAPELRDVTVPLIAIVYQGGYPGPILGVPGAPQVTPPPGSWDVCVETADGSDGIGGQAVIIYGGVSSVASIVTH